MPHLLIENGNGGPQQHELDGKSLSIGRAPDNLLVLDDETVSGHHAEIIPQNGTFLLRDLGSSNGTRVNGKPIAEVEVVEGDQIRFGGVECVFQNRPSHDEVHSTPAATTLPKVKPIPAADLVVDPELPSSGASIPNDQSAGTASAPPEAKESGASFGSKLAIFGRAALEETKRNAKLAGIKGKIEKLKLVDLNKAHYALGKKCYDTGLFREQFQKQFDEIAKLKQSIEENRKGTTAVEGQTTSETLKKGAMEVAMQAKAEGLNLKLQPLFVALGREIEASKLVDSQVETELASMKTVRDSITITEIEGAAIRGDGSHLADLKESSSLLATDSKAALTELKRKSEVYLRTPKKAKFIAVLIVALLLSLFIVSVVVRNIGNGTRNNGNGVRKNSDENGDSIVFEPAPEFAVGEKETLFCGEVLTEITVESPKKVNHYGLALIVGHHIGLVTIFAPDPHQALAQLCYGLFPDSSTPSFVKTTDNELQSAASAWYGRFGTHSSADALNQLTSALESLRKAPQKKRSGSLDDLLKQFFSESAVMTQTFKPRAMYVIGRLDGGAYEVAFLDVFGKPLATHAILKSKKSFTSDGRATMAVECTGSVNVNLANGFNKEVYVFEERDTSLADWEKNSRSWGNAKRTLSGYLLECHPSRQELRKVINQCIDFANTGNDRFYTSTSTDDFFELAPSQLASGPAAIALVVMLTESVK